MYQWYQRSVVCYAYLADVQNMSPDEKGKLSHQDERAFGNSRWFTRGWTLQEFIAPKYVIFYSKYWRRIISRGAALYDLLTDITGIPRDLLMGALSLSEYSISQRMSWAANRETTRIEDKAYCLLGLFDVNMPMLYGEGEKAFVRLQEEIMKNSDDRSIFAWKAPEVFNNMSGSMLAESPAWFRDSGALCSSSRIGVNAPPYSMTNRGLQIHLPLHLVGDLNFYTELFIAELCRIHSPGKNQPLYIWMSRFKRRLDSHEDEDDTFSRIRLNEFASMHLALDCLSQKKTIFVPKGFNLAPILEGRTF